MNKYLIASLSLMIILSGVAQAQNNSGNTKRLSMREEALKRMSSAKYADILGRPGNGPNVGTVAPDFVLESLEEYDFSTGLNNLGNTKTNSTPFRLSDFKGHKPVVLIFGSYT